MADTVEPKHEPARNRFTVSVEGHRGWVEYSIADGVMTIEHTIVPASIGGRGIAGTLVRTALDHARAEGLKVRPACSYADAWMKKHPEYDTLRAG